MREEGKERETEGERRRGERDEGKLETYIFSHRKTTVHTETNPKS